MLHYNTITPLLRQILEDLMRCDLFEPFRLVGGTALSLYYGHRMSIDIDLFTPAEYGSLDFAAIDTFLRNRYLYVDTLPLGIIGMGKSYFVGLDRENCIKLDIYYNDALIDEPEIHDGIRLATPDSIVAMKMDVIQRTGRRKDFYDIHELTQNYPLSQMFEMHKKYFPYTHDRDLLLKQIVDFTAADDDLEPECLKGKHWELIKLDLTEWAEAL